MTYDLDSDRDVFLAELAAPAHRRYVNRRSRYRWAARSSS